MFKCCLGTDRHKNKQSGLSTVGRGEAETAASQKARAGLKGVQGRFLLNTAPEKGRPGLSELLVFEKKQDIWISM